MTVIASTVLAVLLVTTLLGLGLLWSGLLPRRRGDEPRCAACDFDLRGRRADPDDANARADDVAICPECGADLARERAVVHGRRRRRPRRAALGALLLLPIVLQTAASATGVFALGSRPAWWIARVDLPLASADGRTGFLDELARRAQAGTLPDGALAVAARRGLAVQRRLHGEASDELAAGTFDPDTAAARWPAIWGDLVVEALARDLLDEDAGTSFVRNGMLVGGHAEPASRAGRIRPRIEVRHPFGLSGSVAADRTLSGLPRPDGRLQVRLRGGSIGGETTPAFGGGAMGTNAIGTAGGTSTMGPTSLPVSIAPGTHEVVVEIELALEGGLGDGATWPATIAFPATVLAADAARPAEAIAEALLAPYREMRLVVLQASDGTYRVRADGLAHDWERFPHSPAPALMIDGARHLTRRSGSGFDPATGTRPVYFEWRLDTMPPETVDVRFAPYTDEVTVAGAGVDGFTGAASLPGPLLLLEDVPVVRGD